MAKCYKIVFALVILVLQIFSVTACPARCIVNGGACVFGQPTKCCTPICLAQYGICGKTCANINSSCVVSNDCCVPLICENNVCCSGLALGSSCNLNTDCCSGICTFNFCCNNPGGSCTSSLDCCGDSACNENNICS